MSYFKKNFNYPHGIMFHHFHDDKKHPKTQGSISAKSFTKIIKFIGRKNILNPKEFFNAYENKNKNKVCFTFDDGIKSQIDIALPVLEKLKINAIFFIHSSILENSNNVLELHRFFRNSSFPSINQFYKEFFLLVETLISKKKLNNFYKLNKKKILQYKKNYKFYSTDDIKFRLIRDDLLKKKQYNSIISRMMKDKKFNSIKASSKIQMSIKDLLRLIKKKQSNLIGLHSNTHPTDIDKYSRKKQRDEYRLNQIKLQQKLKTTISVASYPNGKFNKDTRKILKDLKILFCFDAVMKKNNFFCLDKYHIPRQDHANIMKKMK